MKNNFTMPYTESGITIDFPNSNYFCFENCAGYRELSAYHFKEMDACWFDLSKNLLYVIELKDYTNENSEQKIWDLVKKTVDSLCMLVAKYPTLLNTPTTEAIKVKNCFPIKEYTDKFKIRFVHILNGVSKDNASILRDEFNNRIKAYQLLFGFEYSLLTYEQAKRHSSEIIK